VNTVFGRIREDIHTIFRKDPAARSVWEVLTYAGLWAVISHRFAHALWMRGARTPARWLSQWTRFVTGVEIHPGATIGRRFFIDHGMGVVIGETAVIGDDVLMYHQVTLGGTSLEKVKRHPTIGDGVLIGMGAKIIGDITVGTSARIGANAVVTRDVPSNATAVGIPARVVKLDGIYVDKSTPSVPQSLVMDAQLNGLDPNADTIRGIIREMEILRERLALIDAERSGAPPPISTRDGRWEPHDIEAVS
jgi:serine O-acetyltransferase